VFDIRLHTKKNALLCIIKGKLDRSEAQAYVAKLQEGVDRLEPGFAMIADLRAFIPTGEEIYQVLLAGTSYAVDHGLSRVVRIVDDSVGAQVGQLQANRGSRELGYQTNVVTSMAEAERLLDGP